MGWGWELLTFVLLGGLAFFLIIGQWTAFALGTIGMVVLYLARGPMGMLSVPSVVWNTANSYILIAVPMFLLMGEVILRSSTAN